MKKYFGFVNGLHLYLGMLVSPFILIFSVSVIVMNHPDFFNPLWPSHEKVAVQRQIKEFKLLEEDLLTAKSIIQQLDVSGEIDWITKTDSTFSFPVHRPGLLEYISLNTRTGIATVTQSDEGFFSATLYLHKMPGPHNAMMRGNSFLMKVWRVITDVFVYALLFVSSTGVFLWYILMPERKLGLAAMATGVSILTGLLILLFR